MSFSNKVIVDNVSELSKSYLICYLDFFPDDSLDSTRRMIILCEEVRLTVPRPKYTIHKSRMAKLKSGSC